LSRLKEKMCTEENNTGGKFKTTVTFIYKLLALIFLIIQYLQFSDSSRICVNRIDIFGFYERQAVPGFLSDIDKGL